MLLDLARDPRDLLGVLRIGRPAAREPLQLRRPAAAVVGQRTRFQRLGDQPLLRLGALVLRQRVGEQPADVRTCRLLPVREGDACARRAGDADPCRVPARGLRPEGHQVPGLEHHLADDEERVEARLLAGRRVRPQDRADVVIAVAAVLAREHVSLERPQRRTRRGEQRALRRHDAVVRLRPGLRLDLRPRLRRRLDALEDLLQPDERLEPRLRDPFGRTARALRALGAEAPPLRPVEERLLWPHQVRDPVDLRRDLPRALGDPLRHLLRPPGLVAVQRQPPVDEVHQPGRALVLDRHERQGLSLEQPGMRTQVEPLPQVRPRALGAGEEPVRLHQRPGALLLPEADHLGDHRPGLLGDRSSVLLAAHVDDGGVLVVRPTVAVRAGLHAEAAQRMRDSVRADGVVVADVAGTACGAEAAGRHVRLLNAAEQCGAPLVRRGRARAAEPVQRDPGQVGRIELRHPPRRPRPPLLATHELQRHAASPHSTRRPQAT